MAENGTYLLIDIMKKLTVAAWALVALYAVSCSNGPDIDDLKEDSAPLVEQLVTEDNTEKLSYRLDRYILDGHPDKLTYTGTVKVTAFTKETDAEGNVKVDSTKMYRDVEIKFRGTDYDKYTVNLYAND